MAKRIGIVGQYSGDIFGVHENYMRFAERFGEVIVLNPINKDMWFKSIGIDALILPGGADVSRWRYSKMWNYWQGRPNWVLERFDTEILPLLIGKIPIFGICRGLQTLNVHFGGTLVGHLYHHPYSEHNSHKVHGVRIMGTNQRIMVNSFHHQCIGRLSGVLKVEALSDDGIPEAISNDNLKIFAVQWHPERFWDEYSMSKVKELFK